MKHTLKSIMLFAAFLVATYNTSIVAQDLTQEVNALGNAYVEAYNKGDAEALSVLYAKEVVFVNPKDGSTSVSTREQIKANMAKDFGQSTGTITINGEAAEPQPDGRVRIRGTFTIASTDKQSGETTTNNLSYDHLIVKEDGQWKLSQMKTW